jgi:hypothetical protein
MDLYNIAKRLSRLIPDGSYTNLNQLFIYVNSNKTLQQFTHNFPLETTIKLVFFIDSIKRNLERQYVEWSINNNLYSFDVVCFGESPGEIECDDCGGSGYDTCSSCGGDGEDSCYHCDGTGKQEVEDDEGNTEEEDCDYCDGRGYESCGDCDGSGSEDCYKCSGDGNITDVEDVPQISVVTYISYDLNLGAELDNILSNTEDVEDTKFPTEYPVLFTTDDVYNSTSISANSIPKKNWGKCFVNKIWDFTPTDFKVTGSYKQVLKLHNQNYYFKINEKLLDE